MTTGLKSLAKVPHPYYIVATMGSFAVSKGKRGEREVCDELQPVVDSVAKELGMAAPRIRRNLAQSGDGGEDIVGLPWYAIEVKRCETLALDKWWRQCVTQARRKAAMASAWDDLTRGGWRRVEAATAPREARTRGGGDEAPSRAGAGMPLPWLVAAASGGGTELPVASTEGAARPLEGLAPLGWMIGRGEGLEAAEEASSGPWRDLGGARVPVLVWRRSRMDWQVHTRIQAVTVGGGLVGLDIDLPLSEWLTWLALDLRGRLQALAGQ